MAACFEDPVSVLIPLTAIGIFLEYPAEMLAGAHIVDIVDALHSIYRDRAVGILLSGCLHAPELRQVCKVILSLRGLRRRYAGEPYAVIRLFTDGRCGRGEQGELYAVHSVIIQDVSEPALQEIHPFRGSVHILRIPPFFEQGIDLIHIRALVYECTVIAIDRAGIPAADQSCFLQGD